MRIPSDEKRLIESLHYLSGVPVSTIEEVFRGLLFHALMNRGECSIPFIGRVQVEEEGDRGKYLPGDTLLRNLRQVRKKESSDVEQYLLSDIRDILQAGADD